VDLLNMTFLAPQPLGSVIHLQKLLS
jgi:hypothetical protein